MDKFIKDSYQDKEFQMEMVFQSIKNIINIVDHLDLVSLMDMEH